MDNKQSGGRKLNILILASWYPTDENPGSGIFFEEQALILQEKGYNVKVFVPTLVLEYHLFKNRSVTKIEHRKGVEVFRYFSSSLLPRFGNLNYQMISRLAARWLKKELFTKFVPDIVHAHCVLDAGVVSGYLINDKIPFVITEHYTGLALNKRIPKFKIEKAKEVYSRANKCFAVSADFMNHLKIKFPNADWDVLHNVLHPAFAESFVKNQISNRIYLLCIASFISRKNIPLILRGISKSEYKDRIIFRLMGQGSLKDEIVKLAKEYQIKIEIIVPGNKQRVIKEIEKSNVLVSASSFETFGMTVMEGLAMGRPVISSKTGISIDIIHADNGFLFETSDEFAEGLKLIIENYSSFDQKGISKKCLSMFSPETFEKRIGAVYKDLQPQNHINQ